MRLAGKMSCQTEIKCGDIFHELFKLKPHHVSKFAHEKVQSCELQEGEYGKEGAILLWKYKHEEKEKSMKTEIVAVDEEKKLITFKAIEGDVFDDYKGFSFTVHTESVREEFEHDGEKEERKSFSLITGTHHAEKEEHTHLINWTFEYEKKYEESPPPTSYLDWALSVTNAIEDQASDVKKFIKHVETKASDAKEEVIKAVKNSPLGLIHQIREEGSGTIFG